MIQWRLLGFLVIATCTVLVYYPSLWHAPRSDQIVYFFVTANLHDWHSLALSCFDLNRWGTYAPGDERLFRPLVYFFLGSEKYLFGYNFWLWQAVGVLLHLTAIWFLMKLLWRIVPGRIAFACTLFFAVFFMNMEMVIWSHINSYLIFVIASLIALEQVYLCLDTESENQFKSILVIVLCFLVAGFVYETANIFAVCVAIFLMMKKKKFSWIILASPVVYLILDVMNFNAHHLRAGANGINFLHGLKNVVVAWGFWIYSALWPGLLQMYFDARNKISEVSFNLMSCYLGVIAALMAIAVGCRKLESRKRDFIFLIMTMLFFYSLVIVLGRSQGNAVIGILTQNTHYYYPYWALMIIIIAILVGAIQNKKTQTVLMGVLLVLSMANGLRLYQINVAQEKGSRATVLLCRSVQQLIDEKKGAKDFSFYVPPDYPGNYAYSDNWGKKTTFIGMLFPEYYKEKGSKYVFQ